MSKDSKEKQFANIKKKGSRFYNPHISNIRRGIWDVILWQLGFYNDPIDPPEIPEGFSYPNSEHPPQDEHPKVSWVNHCTFYVKIEGIHILTDPIWSKRCSPFKLLGPKRQHLPPRAVDDLPPIDLVVLSHDHYDHFDKRTLKEIIKRNPNVIFAVPHGVKKRVEKLGGKSVIELSWGESHEISFTKASSLSLKLNCVPCQHFSGRGLFDKNKTLWCGWVMQFYKQKDLYKQLYFVGDTGYNPYDFDSIGKAFGFFDLSLIPIGTYVPHVFMSPVHINPKMAVKIHLDVMSKLSIGMHWKTFRLSSESSDQPTYDLFLAMENEKLDPMSFRVLEPGQEINW